MVELARTSPAADERALLEPPMRAVHRSPWSIGPRSPRLTAGAVEVWRADLADVDGRVAELLCGEERERAARLLSERHRALWARSRGLLRTLLGAYLQVDPRALRLVEEPGGKPAVGGAGVAFNLSHSGELALYAFSPSAPVGVDVESGRPTGGREAALASRMFGAAEGDRLRAIADPGARQREFLRLWTRYEAKLKCLGVGIGAGAQAVSARHVWVAELDPGAGATGAVACTEEPCELRCWEWPPSQAGGARTA